MARVTIAVLGLAVLAGCGGGGGGGGASRGAAVPSASGDMASACIRSGRQAANRELCGCVQAVANVSLTASDRAMAATFFGNPEKANAIKVSDTARNESFWERYAAFARQAEQSCKAAT